MNFFKNKKYLFFAVSILISTHCAQPSWLTFFCCSNKDSAKDTSYDPKKDAGSTTTTTDSKKITILNSLVSAYINQVTPVSSTESSRKTENQGSISAASPNSAISDQVIPQVTSQTNTQLNLTKEAIIIQRIVTPSHGILAHSGTNSSYHTHGSPTPLILDTAAQNSSNASDNLNASERKNSIASVFSKESNDELIALQHAPMDEYLIATETTQPNNFSNQNHIAIQDVTHVESILLGHGADFRATVQSIDSIEHIDSNDSSETLQNRPGWGAQSSQTPEQIISPTSQEEPSIKLEQNRPLSSEKKLTKQSNFNKLKNTFIGRKTEESNQTTRASTSLGSQPKDCSNFHQFSHNQTHLPHANSPTA